MTKINTEKTISFEKHEEIGMICKILNVRLTKKACELANAFKSKAAGRKYANHWLKANKAVYDLKSHMEEIMFREFPEKASTHIYYGKRPDNFDN